MKREYINIITIEYEKLKKKIGNQVFESSFSKECKVILGNLFVDLSLKFDDLEKVVSVYIKKLNDNIKKRYKEEYENNGINRFFKEIESINFKSKGQLKESLLKESFIAKFNNYYDEKLKKKLLKKFLKRLL